MTITLKLSPRDPIIARDGRPFGADSGTRMKSLAWPLPSTIAGAVRTAVGDQLLKGFTNEVIAALKRIRITGPFPVCDSQVYFPCPHDALQTKANRCATLRPMLLNTSSGCGTDLPGDLWPATLDSSVALEKFADSPAWWSATKLDEWLSLTGDAPANFFHPPEEFLSQASTDERSHVEIDPKSFSAKEGRLFSTAGVVLDRITKPGEPTSPIVAGGRPTELCVRIDVDSTLPIDQSVAALLPQISSCLKQMDRVQPLGGERRLIRIQSTNTTTPSKGSSCGIPLQGSGLLKATAKPLTLASRFRMALLSPAIFHHGWLPGWLSVQSDGSMIGTPPALNGTNCILRLRSVCNQRWDAVSGWSYESHGPKPVRRMVPAGGVYFFEVASVVSGLSTEQDVINRLWMQSVSDDVQDQNDGFGIAAWGVWEPR